MVQHDEILRVVQRLAVETGRLPSFEAVARATGLTKQGVLHHFPSRAVLDRAVVRHALEQVEGEMRAAEEHGSPLETYLRLSVPADADRAAALVVAAAVHEQGDLLADVASAVRRWEALIAAEVGDVVLAEVVRLTADGLFSESLVSGVPPSAERIDGLVAYFRRAAQGSAP